MATIGTVDQLVAVIQAQLAGRAQGKAVHKNTPARETSTKGAEGTRRAPSNDPYAQENLGSLIELRVRQIGRDDPNRGRKAFRAFLEAVLLSHFGAALANDPKFYQMVDDVQNAMEADTVCQPLIQSAIEHLLATT